MDIPLLLKEGKFAKRTGWFVKSRSHVVDDRAALLMEKRRLRGIVWWLSDFSNHPDCFALSRSRFAPGADAPPLLGKEGNVHLNHFCAKPAHSYFGAGFDRYSFDCASLFRGVTLSGSMRTIR